MDSDEEAPKLVDTIMKGKNKRRAESDDEEKIGLDEIIGKSLKPDAQANGEPKLSKKQLKKLKNNAGQPVTAESGEKATNGSPASKKVQFAKNLEQGPSGSTKKNESKATDAASIKKNESKITDATGPKKAENKVGDTDKPAAIRKVEGVTIDDRKSGKGPAAKKGSRVSMRYIGKLQDGKVFDCKFSVGSLTTTNLT